MHAAAVGDRRQYGSCRAARDIGQGGEEVPVRRAFDTELVFICANIQGRRGNVGLKTLVRDLEELIDMAKAFSEAIGGPLLKIGSEWLSCAQQNTWASTWRLSGWGTG